MKCRKIVILTVHAKSDGMTTLVGLEGMQLVKELADGASWLTTKYHGRQPPAKTDNADKTVNRQETMTVSLLIETSGENENVILKLPSKDLKDIETFVAGCQDAGLYILAHYQTGGHFSGNAFLGQDLAQLVNTLPFTPRKICILACDLAEKPNHNLLPFCNELKIKPPPLVAAYRYPVFLVASGKKEVQPVRSNNERKLMSDIRDLPRNKPLKVYYQHGTNGWTRVEHSAYHDAQFAFQ
jgi:hypothetical protein